ncbi:MAG: inositol monophosphatase [Verrucomicrobiales bacterium]|nr:inositol monophosphatase [Verrucomicrobiales bacterium]
MSLSSNDLQSLHDLAVEAAKRAGVHIQSRVDNHSGAIAKDAGDTPASQIVTEVDHESQDLILESLADSIQEFDLGLLTEESEDNSSRHEKDAFWCIDPIDGTLPFSEGVPGYSVSIALLARDGTPLIGVIHDPVDNTTFHALRGGGAFQDSHPIRCPEEPTGTHLVWCMDRSMKQAPNFPETKQAVEQLAEDLGLEGIWTFDQAGSVLNACLITRFAPSIYFKFPKASKGGGSVWDFSATACLMEEWGQPATDIHGDPLQLNPDGCTFMNERAVVYASSLDLKKSIYRLIQELQN